MTSRLASIVPVVRRCGRAHNHSPKSSRDGSRIWQGQGRHLMMQLSIPDFSLFAMFCSAFARGSKKVHFRCLILERGPFFHLRKLDASKTAKTCSHSVLVYLHVSAKLLSPKVMMALKSTVMDTVAQLLVAGFLPRSDMFLLYHSIGFVTLSLNLPSCFKAVSSWICHVYESMLADLCTQVCWSTDGIWDVWQKDIG